MVPIFWRSLFERARRHRKFSISLVLLMGCGLVYWQQTRLSAAECAIVGEWFDAKPGADPMRVEIQPDRTIFQTLNGRRYDLGHWVLDGDNIVVRHRDGFVESVRWGASLSTMTRDLYREISWRWNMRRTGTQLSDLAAHTFAIRKTCEGEPMLIEHRQYACPSLPKDDQAFVRTLELAKKRDMAFQSALEPVIEPRISTPLAVLACPK